MRIVKPPIRTATIIPPKTPITIAPTLLVTEPEIGVLELEIEVEVTETVRGAVTGPGLRVDSGLSPASETKISDCRPKGP